MGFANQTVLYRLEKFLQTPPNLSNGFGIDTNNIVSDKFFWRYCSDPGKLGGR